MTCHLLEFFTSCSLQVCRQCLEDGIAGDLSGCQTVCRARAQDSFKSCTTPAAAEHVMRVLAPDLLARLAEDAAEHGRGAATLTLKWRCKGQGWARTSASCAMPAAGASGAATAAPAVVAAAAALLARHIGAGPFHLTLLNLGATGFAPAGRAPLAPALARLLAGPSPKPVAEPDHAPGIAPALAERPAAITVSRRDYGAAPRYAPISKQAERALHEAAAAAGARPGGAPLRLQAEGPAPASPAGSAGDDDDNFWGGLEATRDSRRMRESVWRQRSRGTVAGPGPAAGAWGRWTRSWCGARKCAAFPGALALGADCLLRAFVPLALRLVFVCVCSPSIVRVC